MKWRKTANSREEMPEYVEQSYHEALVNALVHRDYLVNGSEVHIDIYDDRMEIYSPGGMPDGSMIQDRYQFTVVMPNLNYDVPQNVPQDVSQDKLDVQIIDLIRKDRKMSTEKMAFALGVSSKTIKRHIKEMDKCMFGRENIIFENDNNLPSLINEKLGY